LSFSVEVINTVAGLERYADAWDELAERASQKRVMLSHAWVASYFEHCLKPGQSFRCFFALDGLELVGVLPLLVNPYSVFGLRRLKLRPPSINTVHAGVGFCLRPDCETEILQSIIEAVWREFPDRFFLRIKGILPNSPLLELLRKGIKGSICFIEGDKPDSCVDTSGDFIAYEKTLGKNYRRKLLRAERKLNQLPDVTMEIVTGADVSEDELIHFIELEAIGWKGRPGGVAIKLSPSLVAFNKTLVRRLAKRRWLEWHWLKSEGKPLAGLYMLKIDGVQMAYKIAYNSKHCNCSPGNLLLFMALKRAFNLSEIREINYVSYFEWFRRWRVEEQSYYQAVIFPNRPLSLLRGYLPKVIRKLRLKMMRLR